MSENTFSELNSSAIDMNLELEQQFRTQLNGLGFLFSEITKKLNFVTSQYDGLLKAYNAEKSDWYKEKRVLKKDLTNALSELAIIQKEEGCVYYNNNFESSILKKTPKREIGADIYSIESDVTEQPCKGENTTTTANLNFENRQFSKSRSPQAQQNLGLKIDAPKFNESSYTSSVEQNLTFKSPSFQENARNVQSLDYKTSFHDTSGRKCADKLKSTTPDPNHQPLTTMNSKEKSHLFINSDNLPKEKNKNSSGAKEIPKDISVLSSPMLVEHNKYYKESLVTILNSDEEFESNSHSATSGSIASYSTPKRVINSGCINDVNENSYMNNVNPAKRNSNSLNGIKLSETEGKKASTEFKYHQIVRDKYQRKSMHAVGCSCCTKFYEISGPLKPVDNLPKLFRTNKKSQQTDNSTVDFFTPTKISSHSRIDGHEAKNQQSMGVNEHIQAVGRHRETFLRPRTPTSYWDIDFPDSDDQSNV